MRSLNFLCLSFIFFANFLSAQNPEQVKFFVEITSKADTFNFPAFDLPTMEEDWSTARNLEGKYLKIYEGGEFVIFHEDRHDGTDIEGSFNASQNILTTVGGEEMKLEIKFGSLYAPTLSGHSANDTLEVLSSHLYLQGTNTSKVVSMVKVRPADNEEVLLYLEISRSYPNRYYTVKWDVVEVEYEPTAIQQLEETLFSTKNPASHWDFDDIAVPTKEGRLIFKILEKEYSVDLKIERN